MVGDIRCRLVGPTPHDADDTATSETKDAPVIRLIHPECQATQVLKLFEGSRVPHPAAALAAWKTAAAQQGDALGKTLEAVIAFFNPEMANEWAACIRLSWSSTGTKHTTVPNGTESCRATMARWRPASRHRVSPTAATSLLWTSRVKRSPSPGSDDRDRSWPHSRGAALVFGTTRDELLKAVERSVLLRLGRLPVPIPNEPLESGLGFVLDVSRLPVGQSGPLPLRLAGELLRGLSCRGLHGTLSLNGESLRLESTTDLARRRAGAFPVLDPLGFDRSILA